MKLSRLALSFGLASLLAATAWAQTAPRVQDAWARPTVAGQAVGGGYLKIIGSAAADKLVAVSSSAAGRVELHTMSMDGNVMRMREVPAIEVPAGQTVELKPGGLHLMLMDLKAPLQTGASVPLTLRFEKAGEVIVQLKVQPKAPGAAPAPAMDHSKH